MSPILVRPVREQLEHDRVIRLLQAKYKRKFDVAINPGHEQTAPVGAGPSPWYPDLVLHSIDRGRRLAGVVEVETAESVNHLEAMSQWAAFSRQRTDFHLYVPAGSIDVTRRLCTDHGIQVTEIWAYHPVGEQFRFVLVQRDPSAPPERPVTKSAPVKAAAAKPAPVKPVVAKAVAAKAVAPKAVPAKAAPAKAAAPKARVAVTAGAKATAGKTAKAAVDKKGTGKSAKVTKPPAKAAVKGPGKVALARASAVKSAQKSAKPGPRR